MSEWLTPDDIAAELQIPKATIYQWQLKGTGPKAHRMGRHLRFARPDFQSWCDARATGGGAAA